MLRLALLVVLTATAAASGQPEKLPFKLPTPKGWAGEVIDLPPKGFAPDMSWRGKEEIRFAPGMFKADAPDFFSYALLFWLPADQKTDAKTLEQELLTYYRGLAKSVLAGKKQEVDPKAITLTLKEEKEKAGKRATGEAFTVHTGELKWVEPFATQKPQTLRFEIHIWHNEKHKHHCVFICASPQPDTAAVWKQLREVRDGTTFP